MLSDYFSDLKFWVIHKNGEWHLECYTYVPDAPEVAKKSEADFPLEAALADAMEWTDSKEQCLDMAVILRKYADKFEQQAHEDFED